MASTLAGCSSDSSASSTAPETPTSDDAEPTEPAHDVAANESRDGGADAAGHPQSNGAPCSSASDCIDRRCSPTTKTCGGCFADGAECGAALECCSGTCNPAGLCGIVRKAVGKACDLADGVECVSGAYCNRAKTCEKGCNADVDCAKGEECLIGKGIPPRTVGATGVCSKTCLGGDSECNATVFGRLCDPYQLGTGQCGCKTYRDCPAGRACVSQTCLLDSK